MRKFVLVAALVLLSASAQAAGSRGLTLASNDDQATQPKTVEETKPAEASKYVERPAAVSTAPEAPIADAAKPVAARTPRAERRKPRHDWTEARIIGELHRHGIYW